MLFFASIPYFTHTLKKRAPPKRKSPNLCNWLFNIIVDFLGAKYGHNITDVETEDRIVNDIGGDTRDFDRTQATYG